MTTKYGFVTTAKRSALMSRIKGKNTQPELVLRKELRKLGYRYSTNYRPLPGKPDIVFSRHKVAVFIDGSFWHGYRWPQKKKQIKSNRDYWIKKIEGNIRRDKINVKLLEDSGWNVVRVWDHEVKHDLEIVVSRIAKKIKN